ncbi:MAG: hypothetical protein ACRD3L_03450 [Terriglobales bacterium]
MKNTLVEIRKEAEQAVHGMADGDLKVKAFETILNHLLSGNVPAPSHAGAATKANKPSPKQKDTMQKAPKSFGERVLSLKDDGFFAEQRSIAEIRQELKKNGWHYPVTSMSGPLQSLVQKKSLRRERVDEKEGRKGWKYSNP